MKEAFLTWFNSFQSYQSKQINPDELRTKARCAWALGFQSYQSKQINPDMRMDSLKKWETILVSIVSIQTDQSRPGTDATVTKVFGDYVSIVSIQTDQSRLKRLLKNVLK